MSPIIVPLQLIGWKPQGEARRIVLLVSDALPKIAGDGQVITSFVFFLREHILFLLQSACASLCV